MFFLIAKYLNYAFLKLEWGLNKMKQKLFRIFVGSNNETKKLDRKAIEKTTSIYFDGFTLLQSVGFWKSEKEKTAIVEVLTDDAEKIKTLCNRLKLDLNQQSILMQEFSPKTAFI